MDISIEISCDISGYSNKYSGEHIVARRGKKIEHDPKQLNYEFNLEIRKKCQEGQKKASFVTFYTKDKLLIVCKKSTNLDNKRGSTLACNQVLLSIPIQNDFIGILSSEEIKGLLLKDTYSEYIDYFIANNEPVPLFNTKNIFLGDIKELLYTEETKVYQASSYKNTFLCSNENSRYLLYYLVFRYKHGDKISFISMDYEDGSKESQSLFSSLDFNQLLVSENKKPKDNVKEMEAKMKENIKLNNMSVFDLEKTLKIITQSIELELDILKTLGDNDSSFFSKKKIDNEKVNLIVEESIKDIFEFKKFKKQVFKEFIEKSIK